MQFGTNDDGNYYCQHNYAVAQGGSGGESSDSKFPTGFAAYNAQFSLASK